MIRRTHYPKLDAPTDLMRGLLAAFAQAESQISSESHKLPSNDVLAVVHPERHHERRNVGLFAAWSEAFPCPE